MEEITECCSHTHTHTKSSMWLVFLISNSPSLPRLLGHYNLFNREGNKLGIRFSLVAEFSTMLSQEQIQAIKQRSIAESRRWAIEEAEGLLLDSNVPQDIIIKLLNLLHTEFIVRSCVLANSGLDGAILGRIVGIVVSIPLLEELE